MFDGSFEMTGGPLSQPSTMPGRMPETAYSIYFECGSCCRKNSVGCFIGSLSRIVLWVARKKCLFNPICFSNQKKKCNQKSGSWNRRTNFLNQGAWTPFVYKNLHELPWTLNCFYQELENYDRAMDQSEIDQTGCNAASLDVKGKAMGVELTAK